MARKSKAKKITASTMRETMSKFKRGALHSGRKRGPIVQRRDQAIAIGLSKAGKKIKASRKRGKRK